jgi:DNA-binding SARP family transcriptional activator/Tfp pilus assembly protein PilF
MPSCLPSPILDIRLLGAPEVLVRGRPLAVDTRKAVAILALLATDGRPFARDELGAMLWPEADDPGARGALRRTLSTLRSAVGEGVLDVDRARVTLVEAAVRSDVADLDRRASSGSLEDLQAIAELARGPFLAGFTLRDSPEFDDWRATRAVTIERIVLGALDRLGAALQATGDLPDAIRATERRLALDPLDEAAHVRLMDLLAASGDRSSALRQYRACVAILDRELGVEPLPATTARYEAIRDGAVAKPGTVPAATDALGAVPPRPSLPLVGRDAALMAVRAALAAPADGDGRLVTIRGEAGIGKTRLAETALASVRAAGGTVLSAAAFPAERAIAYGAIVDLLRDALGQPGAAARLEALPRATRGELARLLPAIDPTGSTTEPGPPSPGAHARLVAAVADGLCAAADGPVPGVVWLDDIQWLDAASREALEFLVRRRASRPIAIVLTWRPEDLDADGEAVTVRLLASPGLTDVELGRLDRTDVAALVAAASPGARPNADLAARLFAASEGLPLYVVEVLAGPGPSAPERLPAGVGAVLRERLRTVEARTTQILAAAAVIGRSFDLATLRHASGRSEDEVVDAVDDALRRGLIRETSEGFDFVHGALRALVDEATSLTRRRLLHRRVADAYRLDLAGSGRDDLARLVLVATHERAAGRDTEAAHAHRTAGERAASVYANRAAIEQYEAALALGADVGGLHEAIGRLRMRIGDYAGAIAALEAAAAVAEAGDLPRLEWSLARVHLRRGDLAAAGHHLDAATAGTDHPVMRARIDIDRSALARRRGDPPGASEAARAAVASATAAGDRITLGAAHRMLGLSRLDAGDADGAIADLRQALDAARDDPDATSTIAALVGLAMAEAAAGDVDAAVRRGEAALETCRRIGDRHLEAAVENHLADVLHAAGREEAALEHLRRAVEAFAELGGDPADPDPGIWMLSAS